MFKRLSLLLKTGDMKSQMTESDSPSLSCCYQTDVIPLTQLLPYGYTIRCQIGVSRRLEPNL